MAKLTSRGDTIAARWHGGSFGRALVLTTNGRVLYRSTRRERWRILRTYATHDEAVALAEANMCHQRIR